jgi:hypothetical protein
MVPKNLLIPEEIEDTFSMPMDNIWTPEQQD